MTDLNPADIMAEHDGAHQCFRGIYLTMQGQVCWPYRLAAELAVMREREQRVEGLRDEWRQRGAEADSVTDDDGAGDGWRDIADELSAVLATKSKAVVDDVCTCPDGTPNNEYDPDCRSCSAQAQRMIPNVRVIDGAALSSEGAAEQPVTGWPGIHDDCKETRVHAHSGVWVAVCKCDPHASGEHEHHCPIYQLARAARCTRDQHCPVHTGAH